MSGLPVSCADLSVSIDADAEKEALILEVQALKLHTQEQVRHPLRGGGSICTRQSPCPVPSIPADVSISVLSCLHHKG